MSNKNLLKESIEVLKLLSIEMHDEMDNSKLDELKKVIKALEEHEEDQKITRKDLLEVFSKVIESIPAVASILNFLFKL
ncbi:MULTISPECIES: hypothetical protein [Morganellaceae]|uniref:hypothetical protein n=1 Tax=Morganellaceae TaxID=1903414 RepID=UPI000EF8C8E8|nr:MULTISPECIES: hypothetical protein [Providencia]ELR5041690.1 hypothetical protein [Providencia stuartii]ELR5080562.1 hypothetical protein [Providencia stuartii]EMF0915973.1 hypothetical protein [Providencia stuartii]MBG5896026.1 hypothetical protein [Providencia stuartii]MCR4078314.1 hypothetical protein [Providencia stuartii]